MNMNASGPHGILSVPAEHLPGLVTLAVLAFVAWLGLQLVQRFAARGFEPAVAADRRLRRASLFERFALFALVAGAAVHLALVPTHWADDRTLALLFAADAVGFLVAGALLASGHRAGRVAALAMLGGTAGAYVFYLLQGWESADLAGLLTTTLELAAALVLVVPVRSASSRLRQRWSAAIAVPVALATLLGAAAVAAVPGADTVAGAADAPISLPTKSPAGAITWPVSTDPNMPGMSMVTSGCSTRPTPAEQQAAVDLVNRTAADVAPYRSLAAAKAAGYVPVTPTGRKVVHYVNPSIARRGSPLDPDHVPVLVYVNTPHGAVLSAAMYLALGPYAQNPPQPGGCLMEWHTHTNLCFRGGAVVGNDSGGTCGAGSVNRTTRPMMHVWMAPVTGGPLAPDPGPAAEVVAAAQLPPPAPPNGVA